MSIQPTPNAFASAATVAEPSVLTDRSGGTLLEVMVALILISFGMLGMATTTAVAVRQTTLAEITNDRVAASQMVAERLRAMPFDSLEDGSGDYGDYGVTWTVTASGFRAKRVEIVTEGPKVHGAVDGGLRTATASPVPTDTFTYTVVR